MERKALRWKQTGLDFLNQLPSALALGSVLNSTVTSQAALPASAVAMGARYLKWTVCCGVANIDTVSSASERQHGWRLERAAWLLRLSWLLNSVK